MATLTFAAGCTASRSLAAAVTLIGSGQQGPVVFITIVVDCRRAMTAAVIGL